MEADMRSYSRNIVSVQIHVVFGQFLQSHSTTYFTSNLTAILADSFFAI